MDAPKASTLPSEHIRERPIRGKRTGPKQLGEKAELPRRSPPPGGPGERLGSLDRSRRRAFPPLSPPRTLVGSSGHRESQRWRGSRTRVQKPHPLCDPLARPAGHNRQRGADPARGEGREAATGWGALRLSPPTGGARLRPPLSPPRGPGESCDWAGAAIPLKCGCRSRLFDVQLAEGEGFCVARLG